MSDIEEVLETFSSKVDSLSDFLVKQWDTEGKLEAAPFSKKKSLEELRDAAENDYNNTFQEMHNSLTENGAPEGEDLEDIMKRISGMVYKTASDKFAKLQEANI